MYCDDNKYADESKFGDQVGGDVIFCGNPGVGKSTLLSSISGERFKSGVSYVSGLTQLSTWKQSKKWPGFRFADTPGLADAEMAESAAGEITQVFKKSVKERRKCYLFFVFTLNSGRLNSQDLYTMKLVLESLDIHEKVKDSRFGIIVNKVEEMDDDDDWEEGKLQLMVRFNTKSANVMPFTTVNVMFLPKVKKLQNKRNATHDFPELISFMQSCLPFRATFNRDIEYKGIMKKMMDMMKVHKAELNELKEEFEINRIGLLKKLKDAEEAHELEKKKFEKAQRLEKKKFEDYKNSGYCSLM